MDGIVGHTETECRALIVESCLNIVEIIVPVRDDGSDAIANLGDTDILSNDKIVVGRFLTGNVTLGVKEFRICADKAIGSALISADSVPDVRGILLKQNGYCLVADRTILHVRNQHGNSSIFIIKSGENRFQHSRYLRGSSGNKTAGIHPCAELISGVFGRLGSGVRKHRHSGASKIGNDCPYIGFKSGGLVRSEETVHAPADFHIEIK